MAEAIWYTILIPIRLYGNKQNFNYTGYVIEEKAGKIKLQIFEPHKRFPIYKSDWFEKTELELYDMPKIKPSDLIKVFPMDSIFKKSEFETMAKNIMILLKKHHNDEFKLLTFDEYIDGMAKGACPVPERAIEEVKEQFINVSPYTESYSHAKLFSPCWKNLK